MNRRMKDSAYGSDFTNVYRIGGTAGAAPPILIEKEIP